MKTLAQILLVLVFTGLMAVVMVEWAVGCGESYVDAKGQTHVGECVFIPSPEARP
jgi:hypothetical protein